MGRWRAAIPNRPHAKDALLAFGAASVDCRQRQRAQFAGHGALQAASREATGPYSHYAGAVRAGGDWGVSADNSVAGGRSGEGGPAAEGEPLLAINGDGSNLRKLVAMPDYTSIGSPDWLRDGTRIAFDAWRSSIGETYVDGHVFVVNADGGKPIDLGPGAMPSWSPARKCIVFCQYSA